MVLGRVRRLGKRLDDRVPGLREHASRISWAVVVGATALGRGDRRRARRTLELAIGRGGGTPAKEVDVAGVADAVEKGVLSPDADVAIVTSARETAEALTALFPNARRATVPEDAGQADVVVAVGLERLPARSIVRVLARLAASPRRLIAVLPTWPAGRDVALADSGVRTLRTRRWWLAQAEEAGFESSVEIRRREYLGSECLVLETAAVPPSPSIALGTATAGVRIRVNDDLSLSSSFAWISASLALALAEVGAAVTVAPTRVARSLPRHRRAQLEALVERKDAPTAVASEIGWTHFWTPYRRVLGGRYPLALFAINYEFAGSVFEDHDPWIQHVVGGTTPLAPISTFCRDVLAAAGVDPERMHVVPMGVTDGVAEAEAGTLRDARALKLLHVTNAADVERHGTDLALAAYELAFTPDADVTLVVRDYGSSSPSLERRIAALRSEGHDVRYWPVFFSQSSLGAFIKAFDALLAPFRGEGFGIKILDAMACGVPPVSPFYGGPRDFLDREVALDVSYDVVPVTSGYDARNLPLGNEPQWAECRVDALAAALRDAAHSPDELAARGAAASRRALGRFRWEDSARRVVEIVNDNAG